MTEAIRFSQLIQALNKTLPYLSLPPPLLFLSLTPQRFIVEIYDVYDLYLYYRFTADYGICGNAWSVMINGGNFLPTQNIPLIFKHELLTLG
jgi:hypothetical protein